MLENGGGPTVEEEEILGSFEWSKNEAVLHWDQRVSFGVGDGDYLVIADERMG
jgi:hypothetical protein